MFSGNVTLQHGDFLLRTTTLTAVYSGQSGFGNGGSWKGEQLTCAEAREGIFVISKYSQTAKGDWATFDVMASTVLMASAAAAARRARQYGRNDRAELHFDVGRCGAKRELSRRTRYTAT